MKKVTTLLAGSLLGLSWFAAAAADSLRIVDAWIQEGPPSVPVLAGYLVLENPGAEAMRVVKVASPIAERIEIHRTDITETTATMTRVTELAIPAHGQVRFSPGGYHLMIFGVEQPPRAGEKVPLEIVLQTGEKVAVQAIVRRDEGPEAEPDGAAGTADRHDHHH